MKSLAPVFFLLLCTTDMYAQRNGSDTLTGYIVKTGTDTIPGKLVLPYKMIKEKKEFLKEYEREQWHRQAIFICLEGTANTLLPGDIEAYGWKWNDTSIAIFRSTNVIIPHKGLFLTKGSGSRFLQLELEGPMSLYLYRHTEKSFGSSGTFNDRYLKNEKDEMQVLKIKAWLGIAYNLTEVESWFTGYPGLSKFKIKDMLAIEVWLLVAGYNDWKAGGH